MLYRYRCWIVDDDTGTARTRDVLAENDDQAINEIVETISRSERIAAVHTYDAPKESASCQ